MNWDRDYSGGYPRIDANKRESEAPPPIAGQFRMFHSRPFAGETILGLGGSLALNRESLNHGGTCVVAAASWGAGVNRRATPLFGKLAGIKPSVTQRAGGLRDSEAKSGVALRLPPHSIRHVNSRLLNRSRSETKDTCLGHAIV